MWCYQTCFQLQHILCVTTKSLNFTCLLSLICPMGNMVVHSHRSVYSSVMNITSFYQPTTILEHLQVPGSVPAAREPTMNKPSLFLLHITVKYFED